MKRDYAIFQVPLGWMGLVGNERGIQRIFLPGMERETQREKILRLFPDAEEGIGFLAPAEKELKEYFAGKRAQFEFGLDLAEATPFQRKVYRVMAQIPKGEVRTYAWLAREIGNPKALRAVGGANARNRWPIVFP